MLQGYEVIDLLDARCLYCLKFLTMEMPGGKRFPIVVIGSKEVEVSVIPRHHSTFFC